MQYLFLSLTNSQYKRLFQNVKSFHLNLKDKASTVFAAEFHSDQVTQNLTITQKLEMCVRTSNLIMKMAT